MRIICWLKTILRTLSRPDVWLDGIPFDGCDYVDIEEHKNCTVTISKCEVCGKEEISWDLLFKLNNKECIYEKCRNCI